MSNYKVEITINNGSKIRLELYEDIAPISVNNFINLVKNNFYEGVIFHRVIKDFMIQTGGYYFNGESILEKEEVSPIKGEFTENGVKNDLHHELGVISMARTSDPNSASSQFFICAADCKWLDGKYAAFGKTLDEESNAAILAISNAETFCPHPAFQDFPKEMVQIESIKIID